VPGTAAVVVVDVPPLVQENDGDRGYSREGVIGVSGSIRLPLLFLIIEQDDEEVDGDGARLEDRDAGVVGLIPLGECPFCGLLSSELELKCIELDDGRTPP
jgi:hypothetical protein